MTGQAECKWAVNWSAISQQIGARLIRQSVFGGRLQISFNLASLHGLDTKSDTVLLAEVMEEVSQACQRLS